MYIRRIYISISSTKSMARRGRPYMGYSPFESVELFQERGCQICKASLKLAGEKYCLMCNDKKKYHVDEESRKKEKMLTGVYADIERLYMLEQERKRREFERLHPIAKKAKKMWYNLQCQGSMDCEQTYGRTKEEMFS